MTQVRAVKTRADVERITELLKKHHGDQFAQIWRFSVNVGLRIGDVLSISMDIAKKALDTGYIEIKESKTGKWNSFDINLGSRAVISERIKEFKKDDWLFQSHSRNAKAKKKPLSRQSVYSALVKVGEIVNIKLGTHSGRKTRARMLYESGTQLAIVSEVLNHSSVKETMRYIDITHDEKRKSYHDLVF